VREAGSEVLWLGTSSGVGGSVDGDVDVDCEVLWFGAASSVAESVESDVISDG
jgi:hypothetical protein